MGYDGWLKFNGVEVINSQRAAAYVGAYGVGAVTCQQCRGATAGPFYDPVTDAAPWVDPAVPWSADFLGYFGITVGGATTGTGQRTPLARVSDGAIMGQFKRGAREMPIHAKGFARSAQGMSWGQSWLAGILEAGSGVTACNSPCNGVPMQVLAWCPNCTTDPVACGSATRSLFEAGLLQSPDFSNKRRIGLDCGRGRPWIWDADFLIGAGQPLAFQDPIVIASKAPFVVPTLWPCVNWQAHTPGSGTCALPDCSTGVYGACMVWLPVSDAACADPCNVYGGQCLLSDPLCPTPTAPAPPVTPGDPCVCVISMNPVTTMSNLAAGTVPRVGSFVPILQVYAGVQKDMRRILLRFYRATSGEVCTYANLGTCDVAGEIGIPYLPKGATLLIDGRQQTAQVICADGRSETPILYTSDGPMAQWPVLGCADAWCVAVTVDGDNAGTDAWASVSISVRDDVW